MPFDLPFPAEVVLVLAEIAVRRGDPEAEQVLETLCTRAEQTRDVEHVIPVLDLVVERSLTSDAPAPIERIEDETSGGGPRPTLGSGS